MFSKIILKIIKNQNDKTIGFVVISAKMELSPIFKSMATTGFDG